MPLPDTNSTTKYFHSISLNIDLLNSSSDDKAIYVVIKQKSLSILRYTHQNHDLHNKLHNNIHHLLFV